MQGSDISVRILFGILLLLIIGGFTALIAYIIRVVFKKNLGVTKTQFLVRVLLGVCALAIATAAYYSFFSAVYFPKGDPSTLTKVGQIAPDFEVTKLDETKFRLSDFRGKVIVASFFATWCPPCQRTLPLLNKTVWREIKDERFVMLAIAREQTEAEVRPFQQEHGLTFSFATDPNRTAFAKYATKGIPRLYVITPGGRIAYQFQGYDEDEIPKIKDTVKKLLKRR
jgi:peroxiredoxin